MGIAESEASKWYRYGINGDLQYHSGVFYLTREWQAAFRMRTH